VDNVVAETSAGTIRGRSIDGVMRFTGIPYAAPPIGENRFRSPQPVTPWAGVRDATELGDSAVQIIRPGREAQIGRTSEDCLVLNVWTRSLTSSSPVIVWIHGGGFGQGTGYSATTDGLSIARDENAVVVSVNHRLGLLGYLNLEDVAGADFEGSGTAGMLDLVAALQWVRENISRFGGDPDRVLIQGHSGGGGKVSTLMSMPAARGLFTRAVVHGGPPFGHRGREEAGATAREALQRLEIAVEQAGAIRALSTERMLALQEEMGAGPVPGAGGMRFAPVLGTGVIPDRPEVAFSSGDVAGISLMAGSSLDEARYMLFSNPHLAEPGANITDEDLIERVSASIDDPASGADLVRRYQSLDPSATSIEVMFQLFSDQFFVRTRRLLAAKHAGGGATSFSYMDAGNQSSVYGAYHGVSMPYFFNTVSAAAETMPIDANAQNLTTAASLSHALVEFARTGEPIITIDGAERSWPPFDPEEPELVVFGDEGIAIETQPLADRLGLWTGVETSSATDPWARLFA